jgi:hypothetical protein
MRLHSGGRRRSTKLGCDDFASLFLGEVFQLGNIVGGPTSESLIGHESLQLNENKTLSAVPEEKFRAMKNPPARTGGSSEILAVKIWASAISKG